MQTSEGVCGVDLLSLIFSDSRVLYSDIEIAVTDALSQGVAFVIRTHRVILYAASAHFRALLGFHSDDDRIRVHIDFAQLSAREAEPVVRLFFRLFYVTSFAQLSTEEVARIDEYLLYMYQLAIYFTYDTLRLYCERRLFAAFSLEHFKLFTDYALTASIQSAGKFCILNERLFLFGRFLQWYQCCCTQQLPLPPQQAPFPALDEFYFLSNKHAIIEELRSGVENIGLCPIPQKNVATPSETRRIVSYYRSICHRCLLAAGEYTNIGCIKKGNEEYAFRLWVPPSASGPQRCVVQMAMQRDVQSRRVTLKRSRDESWLPAYDEPLPSSYRCRSEIVLLSNRVNLDRVCAGYETPRSTSQSQEIGAFIRHPVEECYRGQCETCQRETEGLYVIIMQLEIEFVVKSDSPSETSGHDGTRSVTVTANG